MKCLIIHGSYRKGNTYKITELVKSYMQENGNVEFEEIFLSKLNMPFCIGCNQCFLKGEEYCPHNSIIAPIVQKITIADALIIATPTYSLQLPALLKCLLDHMSYNFHRPRFFKKKALVISTTAGGGAKSTANYISDVLQCWGINHVSKYPLRCFSFNYVPDKEALEQIRTMANEFYKEIANENLHSPSMKRIFLFNLWRSMAISGQTNNTRDYRYWADMNLLDKPFPKEVPLSTIKKMWATFAYKSARKMLR